MSIYPDGPNRQVARGLGAVLSLTIVLFAGRATAFDFENEKGTFWGSWDNTITYGQGYRVESRNPDIVATSSGGNARSANYDDGNLNYDKGIYSRRWNWITELEFNSQNVGAFFRGNGWYDYQVKDKPTARTPLSDETKDLVGSDFRVLEGYLRGKFNIRNVPSDLRAGEQVINWGESTFIPGGINSINRVDVSQLRAAGSELKNAFLPIGMVRGNFGVSDKFAFEFLAYYDWKETVPEPAGYYFSTNDFATPGGPKVMLGFGSASDLGTNFAALGGPFIADFLAVPRAATQEASNSGQYGVSLQYFAPGVGTEFNFFFVNYHSRLPTVSGRTGSQNGVGNGLGAATAAGAAAQALAAGLPFATAVAVGTQAGTAAAQGAGGGMNPGQAFGTYATMGANAALLGQDVAGLASSFATYEYARTATYNTEYPEDIKLLGVSFNTNIGRSGWAWQGELSYQMDLPMQIDDVEVLVAALTPLLGVVNPAIGTATQLPPFGVDERVQGWIPLDKWQLNTTFTKIFGPRLGTDQIVFLTELGFIGVPDLPNKTTGGPNGNGLLLDGPGTFVPGNPLLANPPGGPLPPLNVGETEPLDRFPTEFSWGYRLITRFDFLNLIGPWNVRPRIAWSHDASGTAPGPGGAFIEGRYAVTLGVAADYLARWRLDLSYTSFDGAGPHYNLATDRDFIQASIGVAF